MIMKNYLHKFAAVLLLAACSLGASGASSSGIVDKLFVQSGTGAVPRSTSNKLSDVVNVRDYGAKGDGVTNDTPAVKKAVDYLVSIGGGTLYFSKGVYLLNGLAGLDTYKNGVLFPDTNGNFATGRGIVIKGDGVETVLKAGSANMVVLRHSRLYSGGENFKIDGASLANTICLAVAPESLTQTTELVSQSYATYRNVQIENCTEGLLLQPGPTVGGSDSGAFYHSFYNLTFNLNTRAVWMKKDITGNGNRTTRTAFYSPIITRGNTGIQIDGGTEIDIYTPSFEIINTGTSPSATPTAFNYTDTNPANIRIFGGYAEATTTALKSAAPHQVMVYGFAHTAVKDSSEFMMGRVNTGRFTVPKLPNTAAYINAGGENFAGLVVDPDQTGVKTMAVTLNGVEKERWAANGDRTFFGSLGNIITPATGAEINFSRNGESTISALGASASINHKSDFHVWSGAGGALIASLSASQWIPRVDNTTANGDPSFRWSNSYAVNNRTGTGTTLETSGTGSPEGVVTAAVGSMYRRIDGGSGTRIYWKNTGTGNTGWVAIL